MLSKMKRFTKKNFQTSINSQKDIDQNIIKIIDDFMKELILRGNYKNYTEDSRERYLSTQRKFWVLMLWKRNKKPADVTKNDIQEYLNNIPSDKYNYKSSIKVPILSYYNQVLDKKWEKFNIGRKDVKSRDILTHRELALIMNVCRTDKVRLMLRLLFETGVRNKVARLIKISNLMVRQNKIRINGKGRKQRDIPVSPQFMTSLYNYALQNTRKNQKLIFINPKTKKQYSKQTLGNWVKKTALQANIGKHITPHSYRRTYATMIYYGNGKDLVKTSRLMGHANINDTRRYIQKYGNETENTITPSMLGIEESKQKELIKIRQEQQSYLVKRKMQPMDYPEFKKIAARLQGTIDRLQKESQNKDSIIEEKQKYIIELEDKINIQQMYLEQPTWFKPSSYVLGQKTEVDQFDSDHGFNSYSLDGPYRTLIHRHGDDDV